MTDRRIDLEPGQRYGRLVTVEPAEPIGRALRWLCVCDCGNTRVCRINDLRNRGTRSCGCLAKEAKAAANRRTHALRLERQAARARHGV